MHDWHISVESYRRVHTLLSGYFCIMRTSVLSLSGKNILYSVGIYMHDLHVSAEAYRRVHIVLGMYLCIIPTSCMIHESLLTFTAVYLSPSYTVTIQAPIHHDSSRFETDGKIGVHRDESG